MVQSQKIHRVKLTQSVILDWKNRCVPRGLISDDQDRVNL